MSIAMPAGMPTGLMPYPMMYHNPYAYGMYPPMYAPQINTDYAPQIKTDSIYPTPYPMYEDEGTPSPLEDSPPKKYKCEREALLGKSPVSRKQGKKPFICEFCTASFSRQYVSPHFLANAYFAEST
jgi:hypothetical protein